MNRAGLLAKIKALLAKTVANGCTEAEAIAALEKAQSMMDAHDVDDVELQLGAEPVKVEPRQAEDREEIRPRLADAVAAFCQCRAWSSSDAIDTVVFCGLQSDVIFAHWLLDTLTEFVRRSLRTWLDETTTRETGKSRYSERKAFVIGCCGRLAERLRQLAASSKPAGGRGLVLAKSALIERHMRDVGIELRGGRSKQRSMRIDALDAGEAAADQARFDKPVNGGRAVPRIGG